MNFNLIKLLVKFKSLNLHHLIIIRNFHNFHFEEIIDNIQKFYLPLHFNQNNKLSFTFECN